MGSPCNNKILIVDIEATCWSEQEEQRETPKVSELIEFGACYLYTQHIVNSGGTFFKPGDIYRFPRIFIKPVINPILSPFCKGLTNITQKQVDNGWSYAQFHEWTQKHGFQNTMWASWGNYDREHIFNQAKINNLPYPMCKSHINISHLYQVIHGTKRLGLSEALRRSSYEFEGTPHNGNDDAFNAAKLLRNCIL